jgi:xanthine dehydrogenase accessory factor
MTCRIKSFRFFNVPACKLEKAHSPVGIEIGAETPAEIAVSILAEIIRVKRIRDL